ncbi:hypothetical protein CTAYLR_004348 [Chrysophaeum taylorii]|uniref:Replication termination factor 2 n=1 Tax=Chrysophaeum taylorii TaxID=2483200 RepID=A0AAD7UN66_9STRA|nr:hypothetical protein CTAYLR_004348 [Chrysophaeum taylorii]
MGGDGGVIAVQRDFMRGTYTSAHKKRAWAGGQNFGAGTTGGDAEEGVDPRRVRASRVRTCALSGEQLSTPIMACELGNLYNKLAILSALSERTLPDHLAHIRGLRDLVDCETGTPERSSAYHTGEDAPVAACPVTGEALDGSKAFVVVRTTGWILSQMAVDRLGLDALQAEYGPLEAEDLVRLAPDPEETLELQERMTRRRDKARRKADKRRKRSQVDVTAGDDGSGARVKDDDDDDGDSDLSKRRPPSKHDATEPFSEAARIAKLATAQVQGHIEKSDALSSVYRDPSREKETPSASKLFIATAPNRYYLN